MKHFVGVVAILAGLATALIEAKKHHAQTCITDLDCGADHFCVIRTGYCQKCLDCSTYNRFPSPEACATSSSVCGQCLPGFSKTGFDNVNDEYYCLFKHHTDTSTSTTTGLSPNITDQIMQGHDDVQTSLILYGLGLAFIMISIAVTVYLYKKTKICRRRDDDISIDDKVKEIEPLQMPPPRIYTQISENNAYSSIYGEPENYQGDIQYLKFKVKEESILSVNAQPFIYRKRSHSPEEDEDNIYEGEEENIYDAVYVSSPEPPSPVVDVNEDTAPSEWTFRSKTNNQETLPEEGAPLLDTQNTELQQPTCSQSMPKCSPPPEKVVIVEGEAGTSRVVQSVTSTRGGVRAGSASVSPSVHNKRDACTKDTSSQQDRPPPGTCKDEYDSTRSFYQPPDDDSSCGSNALPRSGRYTNVNNTIFINIHQNKTKK